MPWELNGNANTNPQTNFLGTTDNQPLLVKTNSTEQLRVDTAGKVGIGTQNPPYRLSVVGQPTDYHCAFFVSDPSADPFKNQICLVGSAEHSEARLGFVTTYPDGTLNHTAIIKASVPATGGGDLVFQTRTGDNGQLLECLHITNQGNIGIGTPIPGDRLTVAGSVSVEADVKIGGNATVGGDLFLPGADCAEQFDISGEIPGPGTVVTIKEGGTLGESQEPYDKKVAGVISGAGEFRHSILLDSRPQKGQRAPVALAGKVYCKVDARDRPIEIGDLLTTSPTPGHAMTAANPGRAFGAIIGKALDRLERGTGLIPILVALR
jgi:hypothetical protein